MNPKVTIITATFNSSHTLGLTIQSVLAQDFTDFEYLVIGDACTDDSEAVVHSFNDSRVQWHNLKLNSGSQAASNNAGLDLARGEYIAYVGHDDLWFPWHLSSLVNCLEQQGHTFVHSLTFLIAPTGLRGVYGALGAGRNHDNIAAPPSSWLHRCDSQRWREPSRLAIAVDNDFFWRWHRRYPSIGCSKQPSLIKFPSWWWRLYDRRDNFPQDRYSMCLQQDPQGLLLELLHETAVLHASLGASFVSWQQWLKHALRPTFIRLLSSNPEHPLLRIWFQDQRKLIRRARGLKDHL